MIQWHRLLGIVLQDFFSDTPFQVELERDLSLKRQLLDYLIIEGQAVPDAAVVDMPDGLQPLARFNLLTYKSHSDTLDVWALVELLAHFVNLRKQVSPTLDQLLPLADFQLFAIAGRLPEMLLGQLPSRCVQEGVYELDLVGFTLRLLVLSEMPSLPRNAVWGLFSGRREKIGFAANHYRFKRLDTSSVLNMLYFRYDLEGIVMPYTIEDFEREVREEILRRCPPEERLRGLGPEERLKGLGPEERLRGLGPEERLRGLGPEERLKGLGPEERRQLLEQLLHDEGHTLN